MSRQPSSVFLRLCFSFTSIALGAGCTHIPEQRAAVNSVTIRGADQVGSSDVADELATQPTPKFLGLFRGLVYDYELFSRATLQRDLARVERFYRARGYYDAHASAGLVRRVDERHVRVEIKVDEGKPVLNQPVKLEGTNGLPKDIVDAMREAAERNLPPGEPFEEEKFEKAETEVRQALTDRGYAFAKTKRDALIDVVEHTAKTVFTVTPDQTATFGKITIKGRRSDSTEVAIEIPEKPMRTAIDIEEGQPYSTAAIEDATRSLLDLEVFSAVEIKPELEEASDSHVVPLTVNVEPNRLRQLRLGGGAEFDQLKTDLHGLVGWEDHNFMGGLRTFSVEFKPGVVFFPTRLDNLVPPNRLLPEERLTLQLKQPGFIESRTNGYIRPEFNVYPLLVKSDDENASVVGYVEAKGGTWVERSYGKFYGSVGYNIQVEKPFAYKGPLDPDLSTLIISNPEVIARLDFRDDRVHPKKGVYLNVDFQVAGGVFGGTAQDVKVQPEVRTYVPIGTNLAFTTRASVGFLIPSNYGDIVQNHLEEALTAENRAARTRDIQTVFFRGFYSGGPSSNRGFPMRSIAPHGVVPFLNPATASQQVATRCDQPLAQSNPSCSIPIGGFTLWELSNEFRFPFYKPLSFALFVDMSDVSPHTYDLRLNYLHFSAGVGARYDTPVGPIRLDIGYRVQPLQVLGYSNEDEVGRQNPIEGVPPKILGVPIAIAFGIGEAY